MEPTGHLADRAFDWITKRIPVRYMAALFMASLLLLVLPRAALAALGIDALASAHRAWIAGTFIFSAAVLLTYPVHSLGKETRRFVIHRFMVKRIEKRLQSLTRWEKAVLKLYIEGDTRSHWFPNSGTVQALVGEGILYLASREGSWTEGFPYNIGLYAWEYLRAHPELLKAHHNEELPDVRRGLP